MLQIDNQEYFDEVVKMAKDRGLYEPSDNVDGALKDRLEYLDKYGEVERGDSRCWLYKDFADHSFYIVMEKRKKDGSYERAWNGGLLFHEGGDSGVGAPTFSVRLGSCAKPGWSIHT